MSVFYALLLFCLICLLIHLFLIYLLVTRVFIYVFICPFIYLPPYLSICLSIYPSICFSIYLFICFSIYLSIFLSIYLSIFLYIYLSVYLYIYLFTSVRETLLCFIYWFWDTKQKIVLVSFNCYCSLLKPLSYRVLLVDRTPLVFRKYAEYARGIL